LGGITVYLTGAGVLTIWTRFQQRERAIEQKLGITHEEVNHHEHSEFWNKAKAFYFGMVKWISGEKGAWALFITSALIISPFYPAGLAAGSLRMGLVKFFLISLAGRTVSSLIVAFAGYYGLGAILNLFR
jgi:membrane protein YqaA with SNARE-associated domain